MKFYCTPTQLTYLTNYFDDRKVIYDHSLIENTHPVFATLIRHCYDDIRKTLNGFKGRILEIGPGAQNIGAYHNCILANTSQDASRYTQIATNLKNYKNNNKWRPSELYNAANGFASPICHKGTHACKAPADVIVSVHAHYDIPFHANLLIMNQHNADLMYAYMYLPSSLHTPDLSAVESSRFGFKMTQVEDWRGTRSIFSFQDGANVYIHSTVNWRKYLTHTSIIGDNSMIVVEIDRSWGILYRLKFIRINRTLHPVTRSMPMPNYLKEYVVIPNLWKYAISLAGDIDQKIYIPTKFFSKCMDYLNRQADGVANTLTYSSFAAYMTANASSITLADQLIWRGWHGESSVEWTSALNTIYIMGIINRADRHKYLADFINYMRMARAEDIKSRIKFYFVQLWRKYRLFTFDYTPDQVDSIFETAGDYDHLKLISARAIDFGITDEYMIYRKCYDVIHPMDLDHTEFGPRPVVPKPPTIQVEHVPVALSLPALEYKAKEVEGYVVKKHKFNIIFDPPKDGCCGGHILQKYNGDLDITTCNWVTFPELVKRSTVNILAHTYVDDQKTQMIVDYFDVGSKTTISILLDGPHFVQIDCSCVKVPHVITSYSKLPLNNKYLYVNAANAECTDAAAQAKAFRKLFPNYTRDLKLPLSNTTTFLIHQGYHLCIADALSQNNNSDHNIPIIYQEIIKYATDNRLGIYMPLVGCGLYASSHRTIAIAKQNIGWPMTIVTHDMKEFVGLNELDANTGGGFTANVDLTKPILEIPVDEALWAASHAPKTKLDIRKFTDIIRYKKITEISCAPGHLAEFCSHDKSYDYTGFQYVGPGALEMTKKYKPAVVYKDFDTLPIIDTETIFIDIGPDQSLIDCFPSLANYLKKKHKYKEIIMKVFLLQYEEVVKSFPFLVTLIKPDHSNETSSEAYLVYPPRDVTNADASFTFDYILNCFHNHKVPKDAITFDVFTVNIQRYIKSMADSADDFHKALGQKLSNLKLDDVKVDAVFTSGVAGSGKTRNMHYLEGDIYVAPLKHIVDQFKTKNPKVHACTHEVFIMKLMRGEIFNTVFVDEAHMLPRGWFGVIQLLCNHDPTQVLYNWLHLMVDPFQIPLVDFNNCFDKSDQLPLPQKWHLNATKRFGSQTTRFLNHYLKDFIPPIETNDKKDYVHISDKLLQFDKKKLNKYHILTFSQAAKESVRKKGFSNYSTIHEAEGCTFERVLLYVHERDVINNLINNYHHTYVAMTRHSEELLIVVNSDDGKSSYFNHLGKMLEITLDRAKLAITNDVVYHEKKIDMREADPLVKEALFTDIDSVETILQENIIAKDGPIISISTTSLPDKMIYNNSGNRSRAILRIKGSPTPVAVTIKGHRIAKRNYVAHYHPKNQMQSIKTFINRYARVPLERNTVESYKHLFSAIRELQKGFIKFTKFSEIEEYHRAISPTFEQLKFHAEEYLKSCQEKMNPKVYAELNAFIADYDKIVTHIDHFMKKQPKYISQKSGTYTILDALQTCRGYHKDLGFSISSVDDLFLYGIGKLPHDGDKPGQGISSWPKFLNLLLCAYTRHANSLLPECMATKNTKGYDCVYACNKSDQSLSNDFAALAGEYISSARYQKMSGDFVQHDTSHSYIIKLWQCLDFIQAGFAPESVLKMFQVYSKWIQHLDLGTDAHATIHNFFIQHSGSPDTIHGNTKLTIAANGILYDITELVFAAFKGDDSFMIATKFKRRNLSSISAYHTFDTDNIDLGNFFDFRMKEDMYDPAEMICNIITPHGFFPDVVRRVTRIISKVFADEAEYNEAKLTLKDCVNVVNTDVQYHYGLTYAESYYRQIGYNLTAAQIETLFNFCANIDKIPLGPLTEYVHDVFECI